MGAKLGDVIQVRVESFSFLVALPFLFLFPFCNKRARCDELIDTQLCVSSGGHVLFATSKVYIRRLSEVPTFFRVDNL